MPAPAEIDLDQVREGASLLRFPHRNGGLSDCRTSDSEKAAWGVPSARSALASLSGESGAAHGSAHGEADEHARLVVAGNVAEEHVLAGLELEREAA